ncbi:hypothetical protein TNCV_754131 [Trichonephila clavipes]|nr:hypothetical protein TNCV_754131 [Trichonephila clavipes]
MTHLDTESIRLFPLPARSSDLWPIENTWSWISKRLSHRSSPATTIDEVCHTQEEARNYMLVSFIQAQFDSMTNGLEPL